MLRTPRGRPLPPVSGRFGAAFRVCTSAPGNGASADAGVPRSHEGELGRPVAVSSRGFLGTRASRPHSRFRGLRPRAGGTPAHPGAPATAVRSPPPATPGETPAAADAPFPGAPAGQDGGQTASRCRGLPACLPADLGASVIYTSKRCLNHLTNGCDSGLSGSSTRWCTAWCNCLPGSSCHASQV